MTYVKEFINAVLLGALLLSIWVGLSVVFEDRFWMQVAEAVR